MPRRDPKEYMKEALAASQGILDQNRIERERKEQAVQQQILPAVSLTKPGPDQGPSPIDGGGITEAAFNKALSKMLAASGGKISVRSGKRSREKQAQLYAEAVKKHGANARKWAAPPGHSKHEIGLAADLAYADAAARTWAHQNAKNFGLHFPLGHEPWHAELLGSRGKK